MCAQRLLLALHPTNYNQQDGMKTTRRGWRDTGILTVQAWPSSGGGGGGGAEITREWSRLGLSSSRENGHLIERPRTRRFWAKYTGRERRKHKGYGGPTTVKPPRGQQGPGCRPRAAKGGRTDSGNGVRCRQAARSADASAGG